MKTDSQTSPTPWYKGRTGFTLLVLLGVGGAYALNEHWAHALPYLPWLILLACPLMHVFMHHGHGGHGGNGGHSGHGGQNTEKEGKNDE